MGCYLSFNNYAGHAINIVDGVGNKVEYNIIGTINLQGDLAVLQENINDSVNNIVKNNYKENNALSVRMDVTIPDNIKTQNNLVLNVNLTYKNGTSYSSPYVAVEDGILILRINGVEVSSVDVVGGITTINYTLTDNDLNSIYVELIYGDDTLVKNISVINKTVNIIKQDSTVVLPNITNDGVQTKVTIITIDEKVKYKQYLLKMVLQK